MTTREHALVDLSQEPNPHRTRDALLAATAALPEAAFRLDRLGRLHARQFVGMVQADGLSVEILPKVSAGSTLAEDAEFLLRLLTAARLVPQRLATHGNLARNRMPLLEMIIRHAAEDMAQILGTHGVPRRYHEVRESLPTLTGVLDTERAMRQMPHERDLIPVVHAPMQGDNPLSRMLLSLAESLHRLSRSRRSRMILADCIQQLSVAQSVPLSLVTVEHGAPTSDEAQWQPAHELALGLCTGHMPNPTRTGRTPASALLFSLDDIFETLLRRALETALHGSELSLLPRTPTRHFLVDTSTGKPRLRLRPDLVVRRVGTGLLQVGDAKWKRIISRRDGLSLDREDVYQLSAYMNRYRLERGVLFLPGDRDTLSEGDLPWHRRLRLDGSTSVMDVVAVDVVGLVDRDKVRRSRALGQVAAAFTVLAE